MENARGLGRHLAGRLAATGEAVVDVAPKPIACTGSCGTSSPAGWPGSSPPIGQRILRGMRPRGGASDRLRRRLASEILREVRTLDRKIAELDGRIEAEVEASGTTLTEIFGVGPILAATILGTVGDVARFPTKAHFASYSGTAPVEASSGKVVRHRLSLGGNRHLNSAPCTWPPPLRPGRALLVGPTTARRWMRASPARRRCGASRGASRTQSTRTSWRIRRRLLAAPLDKEEPRTAYI
jgi:Transposase IS116/IS110/IS902 family